MDSKTESFQRIEAIFHEALAAAGEARAELIARHAVGTPDLAAEVRLLLEASEREEQRTASLLSGAGRRGERRRIGRQADWPLCAGSPAGARRHGRRLSRASRRRRVRAEGGHQADRSAAGDQPLSEALSPGTADSGRASASLTLPGCWMAASLPPAIRIW